MGTRDNRGLAPTSGCTITRLERPMRQNQGLQGLPAEPDRRSGTARIPKRRTEKGLHQTIKSSIRVAILFYKKERRKTPTSPRLQENQRVDNPRSISPATNTRTNISSQRHKNLYKVRRAMGV